MSAVLFKPEQQDSDDLKLPITSHNNSSISTPMSTYNNSNNKNFPKLQTTNLTIYDDVLDNKMNSLRLHDTVHEEESEFVQQQRNNQTQYCDGSDSGVEIPSNTTNVTLQRALSSNSAGYDDHVYGINLSCNSSLISCTSDAYDLKQGNKAITGQNHMNGCRSLHSYECCSENGSESSSVAGPTGPTVRRLTSHSNVKKKVAMFEPNISDNGKCNKNRNLKEFNVATSSIQQPSRPRLSGLKRALSLPRPSQTMGQQVRDRCTEKFASPNASRTPSTCLTPHRAQQQQPQQQQQQQQQQHQSHQHQQRSVQNKPQKPDNLPNSLSRATSMSMQRLVQRTPSLSRARTPCTPEDGRWPGVNLTRSTSARRGMSDTPDIASMKIRSSMMASTEMKSNITSAYGTLPRRRKQKSVEDLTGRSSRSSSISRETRLTSSIVMSSRKSLVCPYGSHGSVTPTQQKCVNNTATTCKTVHSSRKNVQNSTLAKIKIYHETGSQTVITSGDLEKAFAGTVPIVRAIDAIDQYDQESQVEIRDREMERLREEVKRLTERERDLNTKLKREYEDKLAIQRELHLNTQRVMGLLTLARVASSGKLLEISTPTSDEGEGSHDSLLMLESQIQISGHELIERQQEIGQLRKLCRSLQCEMERSLIQQEYLMQEKAAIEQESSELQDFLQHEKAAMCDALKDMESDYQQCKRQLSSRDEEVKLLRDECRHLVRLNEQRRQETRTLQAKLSALETKSKELTLQEHASVTGATTALSGLHTRLDNLVEQLVSSYNISDQDLEDIGFQNESQCGASINGELSADCENTTVSVKLQLNGHELIQHSHNGTFSQTTINHKPYPLNSVGDGSLSPQRNKSFIAAVIDAIRNATTHSSKKLMVRQGKRQNYPDSVAQMDVDGKTETRIYQLHKKTSQSFNDDSDSTEMLDSETEPCLMMDNVLEDVNIPDTHSHNMMSSGTAMISQIEIELPSDLVNTTNGDESLHNLSQAIVNRQNVESQVRAMAVHKYNTQVNVTKEIFYPDSLGEMPSLIEYSVAQIVTDEVIEVDNLVTKLLKVLRLIQIDNDNCIQQLIIDKNKLQQQKEDMLEKIKDLQDINVKLQDELMDATQQLLIKTNDLSNTKADIQRHRNEIDRLTEDICNLSTLCSNYRKLSPSTELPSFQASAVNVNLTQRQLCSEDQQDDIAGILNLLKMWQTEGQLNDKRIQKFMEKILQINNDNVKVDHLNLQERLLIYANQLENVITVLDAYKHLNMNDDNRILLQLRKDLEVVKQNANWSIILEGYKTEDIINAN